MGKKITLEFIFDKYKNLEYSDNYNLGGGLSETKFASNRHENAICDEGKLTLGRAVQLFKRATGLDTETVREVIKYAVPNMEWHHSGKLPKTYGGGMKKTYFLNAAEISDLAKNWDKYQQKFTISKISEQKSEEEKREREERVLAFLQANARKIERVSEMPKWFYLTKREMLGKYGWFDSTYKNYNLPEYYSGWAFDSEEQYNEFLKLF